MSRWVKLPEGAQVTLGSKDYEDTQGLGPVAKVIIGAAIFGGLWLYGANHDDAGAKQDTPRPTHSVSVSVRPSN